MPYIDHNRMALANGSIPETAGELNFAITNLVVQYLRFHARNYETMNAIIGALECAKIEFYRRVVRPYEDEKCAENGDVY